MMTGEADLRRKLKAKTIEANDLRAKLRTSDHHLRKIIKQLEQMLDEAGIDWRRKLEIDANR